MSLVFWRHEDINPLAVLLIHSGSRGDRILFRYPPIGYEGTAGHSIAACRRNSTQRSSLTQSNNPYALNNIAQDPENASIFNVRASLLVNDAPDKGEPVNNFTSNMNPQLSPGGYEGTTVLSQMTDELLQNLLSINSACNCEKPLLIKVDSVIFVGYPCYLEKRNRPYQKANYTSPMDKRGNGGKISPPAEGCLSIIFALSASAPRLVVDNFYYLAKKLTCSLRYEEYRRCYFSRERDLITQCQDDIANREEEFSQSLVGENADIIGSNAIMEADRLSSNTSPVPFIAQSLHPSDLQAMPSCWRSVNELCAQSSLCNDLRLVYQSMLQESGRLSFKLNNSISISHFSIHKALHICDNAYLQPELIVKACKGVKPFHSLLLMIPRSVQSDVVSSSLAQFLPKHVSLETYKVLSNHQKALLHVMMESVDAPPSFARFLRSLSPVKNFQEIALESDLTLPEVYQFTEQLVTQGRAILIYPINVNNQYIVNPNLKHFLTEECILDFSREYWHLNLSSLLSAFSTPTSLNEWNIQDCSLDVTMLEEHLNHFQESAEHISCEDKEAADNLLNESFLGGHELNSVDPNAAADEVPNIGHVAGQIVSETVEKTDLMELVSWLLRHRILLQLHTYVNWCGAPIRDNSRFESNRHLEEILTKKELTKLCELIPCPQQLLALMETLDLQKSDNTKKLIELLEHFQNKHHIESVMMLMKWKRIDLMRFIDQLSSFLVTFQTFDPVTSAFAGFT